MCRLGFEFQTLGEWTPRVRRWQGRILAIRGCGRISTIQEGHALAPKLFASSPSSSAVLAPHPPRPRRPCVIPYKLRRQPSLHLWHRPPSRRRLASGCGASRPSRLTRLAAWQRLLGRSRAVTREFAPTLLHRCNHSHKGQDRRLWPGSRWPACSRPWQTQPGPFPAVTGGPALAAAAQFRPSSGPPLVRPLQNPSRQPGLPAYVTHPGQFQFLPLMPMPPPMYPQF